MGQVMTWEEIEAAFNGEWVLIEDPETTTYQQVTGGRVIFHSKDRAEIHRRARELPRLHHAILYVGDVCKDMVYIL